MIVQIYKGLKNACSEIYWALIENFQRKQRIKNLHSRRLISFSYSFTFVKNFFNNAIKRLT